MYITLSTVESVECWTFKKFEITIITVNWDLSQTSEQV